MNKSYIALKAVGQNFESLWMAGKLCRTYEIGKTLKFHPDYPGYLIHAYGEDWKRETGKQSSICRVVVVSVPANHLTTWGPWLMGEGYWHDKDEPNLKWKTYEQLKPGYTRKNRCRGTTRLTVLEEIPNAKDMESLEVALEFYSFKYQLQPIP